MGIDSHTLEFLLDTRKSGLEFGNTLTLGRQDLLVEYNDIEDLFNRYNISHTREKITNFYTQDNQFSEPLIEYLGATVCQSMDFSDYENATIVHDLNKPIENTLKQKFDTVIDGGTLEHVFNFPQAIKNCMELLKTGGHFISITPANNFMGHGFYQLSPELFYRVLSAENGFKVIKMILCEVNNENKWYAVADPKMVSHRVGTVSAFPCYLLLVAEKISHSDEIFKITPQQSDYANEWANKNTKGDDISRLGFWKGKITPSSRGVSHRLYAKLKYPAKYLKNFLLGRFIYKQRDLDNENLFTPYVKGG